MTPTDQEPFELCKELWELMPEWTDTHSVWYFLEDYDCVEDSKIIVTCKNKMGDKKSLCPYYTLEYLLDRLPKKLIRTDIKRYQGIILVYHCQDNKWEAKYQSIKSYKARQAIYALLKLTIALAREGLVK